MPRARKWPKAFCGTMPATASRWKAPGSCRAGSGPEAITVMKEIGIDIASHRSKHVDEFAGRDFDYVLTVCDNAKESCPIYPGHGNRLHRNFEDPSNAEGTEEERLTAFRRVRDELRGYLRRFPQSNDG